VDRKDPDSRKSVAAEIDRRARDDRWMQVFLFPEGTCTNGKNVITFKAGAFAPRVPVQPVAVHFPAAPGTIYPGWVGAGPGLGEIILRLLCRLHNRMQVTWLPPVAPLAGELEPATPKLFAKRVQGIVASALGVPATEHSYEDVQLMAAAAKMAGDMADPLAASDSVVELYRLRRFLGVNVSDAKEYLGRFREVDADGSGRLSLEQFRQIFGENVPKATTARLFELLDTSGDGSLDFREYLIGSALFNAKDDSATEHAFKLAFHMYDASDTGALSFEEAKEILRAVYPNASDLRAGFEEIDTNHDGQITKAEFIAWARSLDLGYAAIRDRLFYGDGS